jgi:hypothetical protein
MLACERNGARVFAKDSRYYCDTFPLVAKVFTIAFASEPFPAIWRYRQPFALPP